MVDSVIIGILQATLALILLAGGLEKAKDMSWFADAVRQYDLVPEAAVWPVAFAIPVAEFAAAAGLLHGPSRGVAAAGVVGLLLLFAAAIGINLARGRRQIDCGCWGPAAERGEISGWLALRNLALAALAGLLFAPVAERQWLWLDFLTVGLGTVTALFLFGAANRLIANAPGLANLRRFHD